MKIYTRTGDTGLTGLFGGQRVSKNCARVEAYGAIDELNACLGVALAAEGDAEIRETVMRIQNELFVVGGDLATPLGLASTSTSAVPRVTPGMTARLEGEIDAFTDEAGPLMNFILPGGAPGGAHLHHARTVCRRAERRITTLAGVEEISPEVLTYVNRLSDHLFELARLANHRAGAGEAIWSREIAAPAPHPPQAGAPA